MRFWLKLSRSSRASELPRELPSELPLEPLDPLERLDPLEPLEPLLAAAAMGWPVPSVRLVAARMVAAAAARRFAAFFNDIPLWLCRTAG